MLLFVEKGHMVTLIACSPLDNMSSHIHSFYCLVKSNSLPGVNQCSRFHQTKKTQTSDFQNSKSKSCISQLHTCCLTFQKPSYMKYLNEACELVKRGMKIKVLLQLAPLLGERYQLILYNLLMHCSFALRAKFYLQCLLRGCLKYPQELAG